jgi:TolB-like protein/DNA-binding winged helix-turn-helix (wHTH) protein
LSPLLRALQGSHAIPPNPAASAIVLPVFWGFAVPVSHYQFGEFELDSARFELRRDGQALKLERIPLELLILLAEKDGNLVSRQEIIERLWGKEVFVDTEHGINTAIRKIRAALREDAEEPRFVQTVLGKGYRFVIAPPNGNTASQPEVTTPVAAEIVFAETVPAKITYRHRRDWRPIAITIVALFLVAGLMLGMNVGGLRNRLFAKHQIGPIHSIAVLPLANLSGNPSQDYFADGMTDELITMLAKNTSLRVVSRTSAMQFKGVQRPVHDIARELGVDGVLEGSVERSGNRVHMTVQLIYAPSDTHIWAQSYDRDTNEVFLLPTELSQTIARQVKIAVSPAKPQRYINPEAHDAYLMGRFYWFRGNNIRSKEYFEKAVHLQPDYAAAWDGIADAYAQGAWSDMRSPEALAEAWKDARRAVELDDSLPEGHNTLAALYLFDKWDWPRSEEESRRAIELNPNYAHGHHVHSYALLIMNRDDEALQEQKRADEIDPFERPWALGRTYIYLREYDAAINNLHACVEVQPQEDSFHLFLSEAYWLKGMWKESEQELEIGNRLAGNPKLAEAEHQAFERNGEKGAEQFGVNEITNRARRQYVSPWDIAFRYAFLGDKEKTLKFLEAAYQEHSPDLVFLQKQPVFDFLHANERYRAIVKKVGLVPAY